MTIQQKTIGMLLESEFPPDIRVEHEALTLAKNGFRVILFSLNFSNLPATEEPAPNLLVVRKTVNQNWFNKWHTTVRILPFYRKWWRQFILESGFRLDAVHVHDLPLAETGWRLAEELSAKFVLDLHENYPAALEIWSHSRSFWGRLLYPRSAWRRYETEAVSRAHRVIVVVEEALQRFREKGIAPEKFVVITNAPDLDKLREIESQPVPEDAEKFDLIYVGGLGPHRGLEVALRALALLHTTHPNLRLGIVGSGSGLRELKALAEELGIASRVQFTGWLPFAAAMQLIRKSEIALLPAMRSEHTDTTIPHKLFQYMYFKKPVIVSDCKPLKRIVEETGVGAVFPAGQAAALAQEISRLLADPALRKRMGENGRQAVLKKYNWQREGEKLVEVYNGLLS